jgi:hypothetical protein
MTFATRSLNWQGAKAVGRFKNLDVQIQELEEGIALLELENLERELRPLDFDCCDPDYSDDVDWWKQQDAELEREELEEIERKAEIQEYRTQGYM